MKIKAEGRTVTLTKEQIAEFEGLTKLQQGVALKRLSGMPPSEAYVAGGGKAKTKETVTVCAYEILNNPSVSSFIKSFEEPAAERIAAAVMTKEEMIERLTEMARVELTLNDITKPENIKHVSEVVIWPEGPVYKMKASADRRAAMKQLADMLGYNKPAEINVTGELLLRNRLDDFYGSDS